MKQNQLNINVYISQRKLLKMWQYETNDKMQKVRGYKAKIIMNMSFFISKMLRQNSFSLLKHKDTCNCKICIQSQQNSAVTRM